MVRVLLIRHAQSMQNEFMEGVSARIARGELEPSELNATMRNAPALHDAGADSPLTELGEQQAELLGEFYAPLLMEKAREGKLRLFVSPQMRTCQTAAPLYSRLHQETGIRAAVRVELHEHGPPMHMDNLYAPTPPLPLQQN